MRKVMLSVALVAGAAGAAPVTLPAVCQGDTLGALVACRLRVSEMVGRDKYATGAAIEDKAREAVVIANGARLGVPLGISEDAARRWWSAQIEASKAVQRRVTSGAELAGLPRVNRGPKVADLRGVLDVLTGKMTALYGAACADRVTLEALRADPRLNVPALLVAVDGLPACSRESAYALQR